jgi:uncharacterized protein (TIGR03435 family)
MAMKHVQGFLCSMALLGAAAGLSYPQSGQGTRLAFDVASIRQNKSDAPAASNFHLGPGDFYTPNGGRFAATNFPLVTYIFFAYNVMGNQIQSLVSQLPAWVTNDHFDIQARAQGNPTKDQMRLMMRSLLADRFKFAVHTEKRELPVVALVLAKPGSIGPELHAHPADAPCDTKFDQTGPPDVAALCNGILGLPPSVPGRERLGGRNVTLDFFANMLSQRVNLGRPMIDATGLNGTFDFTLEFTPDSRATAAQTPNAPSDADGTTLEQALREQLGLKMEARRGPIDVLVVDHIDHLSEN